MGPKLLERGFNLTGNLQSFSACARIGRFVYQAVSHEDNCQTHKRQYMPDL